MPPMTNSVKRHGQFIPFVDSRGGQRVSDQSISGAAYGRPAWGSAWGSFAPIQVQFNRISLT
jgi:hypothetical protein